MQDRLIRGELVVRLSLVHPLLDAPAAFHRVRHILFELNVGRLIRGMEDLEERAEGLLDALLVPAFDGTAQPQVFADLLVTVRVLDLVVERLGQIVGDQPIATGQVRVAVLGHLPTRKVASEAVHYRQVELWR